MSGSASSGFNGLPPTHPLYANFNRPNQVQQGMPNSAYPQPLPFLPVLPRRSENQSQDVNMIDLADEAGQPMKNLYGFPDGWQAPNPSTQIWSQTRDTAPVIETPPYPLPAVAHPAISHPPAGSSSPVDSPGALEDLPPQKPLRHPTNIGQKNTLASIFARVLARDLPASTELQDFIFRTRASSSASAVLAAVLAAIPLSSSSPSAVYHINETLAIITLVRWPLKPVSVAAAATQSPRRTS
ncbi:hypothetical protein SISSUDRAFT_1067592 [Sistotremastrum suecicum HHB10207 ss-3]|uniref:Uncharacterized protein n=1 Tax=Sistotremastrum suecicum HHB10207 ss-3 TaxID=1314776 RepID=A0A165WY30_9AGAM|nr:hypothetical protein SISSUDRAFT_1067592 [Sistotremastrum suecicum HHB10207 ss-3]